MVVISQRNRTRSMLLIANNLFSFKESASPDKKLSKTVINLTLLHKYFYPQLFGITLNYLSNTSHFSHI